MRMAAKMRRAPTPSERRLWSWLRNEGVAGLRFRRQHVLFGFVADFYCRSAKLAVEVDGPIHESRREYDAARDRVLEGHGIRVVRLANRTVDTDRASVMRILHEAAKRKR